MPRMNRKSSLRKVAFLIALFSCIGGVFCLAVQDSNEYVFLTSVGCLSFAIVLLPVIVQRNYLVLSTWSFAVVSVFVGMFMRGIYIGLDYPSFDRTNFLWLRSERVEEFYTSSFLVLVGLMFCVLGFLSGRFKKRKGLKYLRSLRINVSYLYLFAFFAAVVSLGSTVMYISLTGGFDISNLSSKRTIIDSLDLSEGHRTYGVLRLLANLAIVAHMLVLTDAIGSNRYRNLKYFVAVSLLVLAIFLPFYASSRTQVLSFIVMSIATIYFCKSKFNYAKAFAWVFVLLTLSQVMTTARLTKDVEVSLSNYSIVDSIVVNRNFMEIGKTTHVINSIPEILDYKYGATIGVWALAPIPRGVWPEKPLISLGPVIGTAIYGTKVSGVPPGLIADIYWNFGIFGVPILAFIVGRFMSWLDSRFAPSPSDPRGMAVIYIYGPFVFAYNAFGNSLGHALFNTALSTIFVVVVVRVISRKVYRHE